MDRLKVGRQMDDDFNQKEIEITLKWRIVIVIDNRIWMAWNLNHRRFDLATLIA